MRFPALPALSLTPEGEELLRAAPESDVFQRDGMRHHYLGPSGRWLLGAALSSLGLGRDDEIAILTTSDETYVSTCVTATAFNFARISRKVTPSTRVVILIHEFGYVIDNAVAQIDAWRQAGLVVIEDCAHVMDFSFDDHVVGGLGDFAVYSLPKLIPSTSGGILRARRAIPLPAQSRAEAETTARAHDAAAQYLPKIAWLNQRRLENAAAIEQHLPQRFRRFHPSRRRLPWFFGMLSPDRDAIVAATPEVDWGSTFRPDLLYLSTNPLIAKQAFIDLVTRPPFASPNT